MAKIADMRNRGLKVALLAFDLSSAFNVIDHDILMRKLARVGFHEESLTMLRAFLKNRKVFTKIQDEFSDPATVNIGTPEGGICSPQLFSLAVQDYPVRPLTPLPWSPGADFPDWWTQVRIHVTRSCVCVCRLSQTAALVFASLDCLQNISISRTQSLLSSKKSHSVHQGETQQLAPTSSVIQPQYTFNKQSSEHSNCLCTINM